jgi:UDP-N-acetylmuramate--alanine ligase
MGLLETVFSPTSGQRTTAFRADTVSFHHCSVPMIANLAYMTSPQFLSTKPSQIAPRVSPDASSVHLVGVCGSGMRALAELLIGLGWRVTGSDLTAPSSTLRAMQKRGLRFHRGHDDRFLPRDVDVVVHSAAVGEANPERQLAHRLRIPVLSYSMMLGLLMENGVGVAIAGTHGKSTTTAMVAAILTEAGLSPSAVVGAELKDRKTCGWVGEGDLFVVESCEYQRSFLDLKPQYACILNIEPDHFDCFASLDDLIEAFARFAGQVAADGLLLVNGDCPESMAASQRAQSTVVTFSRHRGADWWSADLRPTVAGTRFRVFRGEEFFAEIEVALPGEHNVANALAAIAISHHAGASVEAIRECLWQFTGIRRRFEQLGSWRGVTRIDDYAHHPTAVAATLRTARARFGQRRIWCAFQPHQSSRTAALMSEFSSSFRDADEILIAPTFAARESPGDESDPTAKQLAREIAASGRSVRFCGSLDRVVATLDDEAQPGDVLITMGAGDINRVQHEFTRRLQRNHSSR